MFDRLISSNQILLQSNSVTDDTLKTQLNSLHLRYLERNQLEDILPFFLLPAPFVTIKSMYDLVTGRGRCRAHQVEWLLEIVDGLRESNISDEEKANYKEDLECIGRRLEESNSHVLLPVVEQIIEHFYPALIEEHKV